MKLKSIIGALGDIFGVSHGVSLEAPFCKFRALAYSEWQTIQAEVLATGIELYRMNVQRTATKIKTLYSVDIKVLGSSLRCDNEHFLSFLNGFKYFVASVREFEEESQ